MAMSRSQLVTLTNMCMIYDNNRVLVQNKIGKYFSGITFPGGHVEEDESLTDAVIREVLEETGLTISEPRLCGTKNWTMKNGVRYIVFLYKTNKFSGELKSSHEGEVFWTDIESMKNMELADSMDGTLKVFLNEDIEEQYLYKENDEWKEALK